MTTIVPAVGMTWWSRSTTTPQASRGPTWPSTESRSGRLGRRACDFRWRNYA